MKEETETKRNENREHTKIRGVSSECKLTRTQVHGFRTVGVYSQYLRGVSAIAKAHYS